MKDNIPWRLIAIICIAGIVGWLGYSFGPSSQVAATERERSTGASNNVLTLSVSGEHTAQANFGTQKAGKETHLKARMLSQNELKQLEFSQEQWRKDRGYFSDDDYLAYATYSSQALYELAKTGDLIAIQSLAKILRDEGQHDLSNEYLQYAATHGSTRALIGLMNRAKSVTFEVDATEEEKTSAIHTMLVFAEVAAMRGDTSGISQGLWELERRDMVLTELDKEQISGQAEFFFDQLGKAREISGLGEFDNSIDPLDRTLRNHMISNTPNPSKWGIEYFEQPQYVTVSTE